MTNLSEDHETIAYARRTWSEGEDRLGRHTEDSVTRALLEDVVDAIMYELGKRVGQSFTTLELVEVWRSSDDWCTEVVHQAAPEQPAAWQLSIVADAAFYRYSRTARDWSME